MKFKLLDEKSEENLKKVKRIIRENGGDYFISELNIYLSNSSTLFCPGISFNDKTDELLFYYRRHQHGEKKNIQICYVSRKKCGKFYGDIISNDEGLKKYRFIIDEFESKSNESNILDRELFRKRITKSIIEINAFLGDQYTVIFADKEAPKKLPLYEYNRLVTSAVKKIKNLGIKGNILDFGEVGKWNDIVWQELSKLKHSPSEKLFWIYYNLVGRSRHSKIEEEILKKYISYEKCFHKYRIFKDTTQT